MQWKPIVLAALLGCGLIGTAQAMNLNQAMAALGPAKASGAVGEQPDGYLGIVQAGGNAAEVVSLINAARQVEYRKLAQQNGIQLDDVQAIAGQKALERTPSGQYIQLNGKWVRK